MLGIAILAVWSDLIELLQAAVNLIEHAMSPVITTVLCARCEYLIIISNKNAHHRENS